MKPFSARSWINRVSLCLVSLAIGLCSKSLCMSEEIVPLKKGDRIIFLGDSITQAGAGPQGYVTLVRKALEQQHPDLKTEVIGAGISGNRVPDLEKRLEKDVLKKKPSIVVIYIGINDVWHSIRGRGTPKDQFEAGLKNMITQIQKGGARVVLCTPSVIGEKHDGSNKLDKMLDEYSEVSRKVAQENKAQLFDLRKSFLTQLKKVNDKNVDKKVLTTDGVHLNKTGNQFVAEQMLLALGVKPSKQTKGKLLRHIVLFQFKDDVSQDQIQEVVDAFAALPKKIDTIVDFEAGTDVSIENKSAGFTHGFVVTFKNEKGRETYLPHPAHKQFVQLVGPRIENVLVFDYWTK